MAETPQQRRENRLHVIRRMNMLGDGEVRAIALLELAFRDISTEQQKRVIQYAWARFIDPWEPK